MCGDQYKELREKLTQAALGQNISIFNAAIQVCKFFRLILHIALKFPIKISIQTVSFCNMNMEIRSTILCDCHRFGCLLGCSATRLSKENHSPSSCDERSNNELFVP